MTTATFNTISDKNIYYLPQLSFRNSTFNIYWEQQHLTLLPTTTFTIYLNYPLGTAHLTYIDKSNIKHQLQTTRFKIYCRTTTPFIADQQQHLTLLDIQQKYIYCKRTITFTIYWQPTTTFHINS